MQIDPHGGTMMCHKANIWYISYNMYIVNQSSTSNCYAAKNINLIVEITT